MSKDNKSRDSQIKEISLKIMSSVLPDRNGKTSRYELNMILNALSTCFSVILCELEKEGESILQKRLKILDAYYQSIHADIALKSLKKGQSVN